MIYLEIPPGWENETKQGLLKLLAKFPHIHLNQVKEKFGRLRIYYTNKGEYSEALEDMITDLEDRVSNSCAVCGLQRNIQYTSLPNWVLPYCKKHFPKEK